MPQFWLHNSIQRSLAASYERELFQEFAASRAFPQAHGTTCAAEGLFMASIFSSAFWSLLVFLVARCR